MDNFIGQKFGELTVINVRIKLYNSTKIKECQVQCSCGNIKWFTLSMLKCGKRINCLEGKHNPHLINLTGRVFSYLTAIQYNQLIKKWECVCICGKQHFVRANTLMSGKTKSCGCMLSSYVYSQARTKPDNHRVKNAIYKTYKGSAKRRGYDFDISFEDFCILIKQNCYYCGIKPDTQYLDTVNHKHSHMKFPVLDFYYNGIDRVDNSQGYIKGNIVTCCFNCNRAKSVLSIKEWFEWMQRVYLYQTNNNPEF